MAIEHADVAHAGEARLQRAQVVDDDVPVLHVVAPAARHRGARDDQRDDLVVGPAAHATARAAAAQAAGVRPASAIEWP